MSINFNTLAPISATVLSLGGLVFQIGRHSEKLDLLNNKENFDRMSKLHNPYGDGLAAKRIVKFIENL